MGELELGAALIPEALGITTVDTQVRPAASPLRCGLRLGLSRHRKPGGHGSKLWGSVPPSAHMAMGLRKGQHRSLPVASLLLQTHLCPEHWGGNQGSEP